MPSNSNSDPLILFCKFSWYFCKNDLKSNLMTSSVSLPFINSSLSLLVYIIRVSSDPGFKEIKLISAVNFIFHSPLYSPFYSGLLITLSTFLLKRDILELLVFYLLYFHIGCNYYHNHF